MFSQDANVLYEYVMYIHVGFILYIWIFIHFIVHVITVSCTCG